MDRAHVLVGREIAIGLFDLFIKIKEVVTPMHRSGGPKTLDTSRAIYADRAIDRRLDGQSAGVGVAMKRAANSLALRKTGE